MKRLAETASDRERMLEEAIKKALDELGVPNEEYPAPIANAVELLKGALAGEPKLSSSPFAQPSVMSGYPLDPDEQEVVERLVEPKEKHG